MARWWRTLVAWFPRIRRPQRSAAAHSPASTADAATDSTRPPLLLSEAGWDELLESKQQTGNRELDTDLVEYLLDHLIYLDFSEHDPGRRVQFARGIVAREMATPLLPTSRRFLLFGLLATALVDLAVEADITARLALMRDAIAWYDAAMREQPPAQNGNLWARAMINKGIALVKVARYQLASYPSGTAQEQLVRDAVSCFDAALLEFRRDEEPHMWVLTQMYKGDALDGLARLLETFEALWWLEEAIACYKLASAACRQEGMPLEWASVQMRQGIAQRHLATLLPGAAKRQGLIDAIACCELALNEKRLRGKPLEWADAHENKSDALVALARLLGGHERQQSLEYAITGYNAAILTYRRHNAGGDWARAKENKAGALMELAKLRAGAAQRRGFAKAIACHDAALRILRREDSPREWAQVQTNKADALTELARLGSGAAQRQGFERAIACCELALEERRREVAPGDWAATQTIKGGTLSGLAQLLTGAEQQQQFRAAIACYNLGLEVQRPDHDPLHWASAVTNKGNALLALAQVVDSTTEQETLEAAIVCYDLALQQRRRRLVPFDWANTQSTKGIALAGLAALRADQARWDTYRDAIACFDAALEEYRAEVAPFYWAGLQLNKGNVLQDMARALAGQPAEQQDLLRRALVSYALALQEFRSVATPYYWAGALINTGNTLSELADTQYGHVRAETLRQAIGAYEEALVQYPLELIPAAHRDRNYGLAHALVALALAERRQGQDAEANATFDRAWLVISRAVTAARSLALREALVPFRQEEWAMNAHVFTLAAAITALRDQPVQGAEAHTSEDRIAQIVALVEEGRARGLAEAAGRRNAKLDRLEHSADRDAYLQAVEAMQALETESRLYDDPVALADEARAAHEHLQSLIHKLRQRYTGFLPEPDLSLSALARGLRAREAVVYLLPLDLPGTLLIAFAAAGEPVMRWLDGLTSWAVFTLAVQANASESDLYGFLPAVLGRGKMLLEDALDALLPRLGDAVMRHVVNAVRQLACHRAVIIAGGYLAMMPLHAATYPPLAGEPPTAPEGRRYACDDLAVTYAPSAAVRSNLSTTAMRLQKGSPTQRMLVVGNPKLTEDDDAWNADSEGYLTYAEWEAERVAALARTRLPALEVDLLANEQATWAAVMRGLRSADLAHLAMHAVFDYDDPERSALMVAPGGRLDLPYLLDPRQLALDCMRLIVLSACQSGMSDVSGQAGEAVGLFGALLAAGAPAVIGTLWRVKDLATAALMEEFARYYLLEGYAPDAALRAAARRLRGIPDSYASPAESGTAAADLATSTQQTPMYTGSATVDSEEAPTPLVPLLAQDPFAAWQAHHLTGAERARQLRDSEYSVLGTDVADFRKQRPEHPRYWAAFVHYGASVPLDSAPQGSGFVPTTTEEVHMPTDDQETRNTSESGSAQAPGDDISSGAAPKREARAEGDRIWTYFAAAGEECPRDHVKAYSPYRDSRGRDRRLCKGCNLVYMPGDSETEEGPQ